MQAKINGSPALWALSGILTSTVCQSFIGSFLKFGETLLWMGKSDLLYLKIISVTSGIFSMLIVIVLVIMLMRIKDGRAGIAKIWIIICLMLWPVFAFTQYYLNMVNSNMQHKLMEIQRSNRPGQK